MTTLIQEIQTAITIAALLDENKLENGKVNWNFVDADVCIQFGDHFKLIGDLLNETADAYEAGLKREKRITRLADDLLDIDFGRPITDFNGNLMGQTEESREWLMGQGVSV